MSPHIPAVTPVPGLGHQSVTPELMSTVGYTDEAECATTSIIVDHHFERIVDNSGEVEIMPLADAVVTYPWVQELMFSLVHPTDDPMLRRAFESQRRPLGTFTWVHDNAVVTKPLQQFQVMTVPQERQFIHDITIIGKNAKVSYVCGSAVAPKMTHGTHVSVSETFIGEGAEVKDLTVEHWGENMRIYSHSATKLEKGAVSDSVSVAVSGVALHEDHSVTICAEGAVHSENMVVFAPNGTHRIMESTSILDGPGARAEQVARMVSDGGKIDHRATLIGNAPGCSGFLECDGLMIAPEGYIESIPALKACTDQAMLSHEASVGMISDDKLDYLMALGLDEDAARDLIVKGFMDLKEQEIPESLKETVENLVSAAREAEM